MVANVGPADWNYDETLSTLRYANRYGSSRSLKQHQLISGGSTLTRHVAFCDSVHLLCSQCRALCTVVQDQGMQRPLYVHTHS
jgi:hypothetical protein